MPHVLTTLSINGPLPPPLLTLKILWKTNPLRNNSFPFLQIRGNWNIIADPSPSIHFHPNSENYSLCTKRIKQQIRTTVAVHCFHLSQIIINLVAMHFVAMISQIRISLENAFKHERMISSTINSRHATFSSL